MTHSFPTRRSSDLEKFIAQHADAFVELAGGVGLVRVDLEDELLAFVEFDIGMDQRVDRAEALCVLCIDLFCDLGPNAPIIGEGEFHLVVEQIEPVEDRIWVRGIGRSEEHTSELQSLMRISYAVFCLQKKKHQSIPDQKTEQ